MSRDEKSQRKGREKLPGRVGRTLRTAWLGGTISSSYLGGRISDVFRRKQDRAEAEALRHRDNALRAVRTMKELRGPLMKIGQLLSTHAQIVPGAWSESLAVLQQQAPPMGYETIASVIEEELGASVDTLFAEFGREAVAAASLGQVHRARLPDGTEVAVKVQYPGAEASVNGDVRNIEVGAGMIKKLLADMLGRSDLDITPMAEELAEHLRQETDYCREAYNAKLLGRLFEDDEMVVVPRVHDSHSGLHVITYDWLEGKTLESALTSDDTAIRERTVRQLTHSFWRQVFRAGVLHADPHPGNYLILPDGRLGLLDYGCVKIFGEHFLTHFRSMVRGQLEGDRARVERAMMALELVDDPPTAEQLDDVHRIARYCSVGLAGEELFDFGAYDYGAEGRALVTHFLTRRTAPPSQRDFLFLTRVVLGYYEYFSRAGAKMAFSAMVEPYVTDSALGRAIEIPPYD